MKSRLRGLPVKSRHFETCRQTGCTESQNRPFTELPAAAARPCSSARFAIPQNPERPVGFLFLSRVKRCKSLICLPLLVQLTTGCCEQVIRFGGLRRELDRSLEIRDRFVGIGGGEVRGT